MSELDSGESSTIGVSQAAPLRSLAESVVRTTTAVPIGPYVPVSLLGTGGFGAVFLATQSEPVPRRVALKVLRREMATETAMRYFELEAKTLASLQHPNIATMLDAGKAADGALYLAMELVGREEQGATVSGWRLTEYCAERRLSIAQRLSLFVRVCHAVHHAHARGVIHRDLKPSNILVADVDGAPVPKVIDFGVSKLLRNGQNSADASIVGAIIGSVAYMSPEQASGSRSITTQSDVFSLGAILYELISGIRLVDEGVDPIAHCSALVRGIDFASPSSRIVGAIKAGGGEARIAAEQAERMGLSTSALALTLRTELEWIPMKAIAHEPNARYGSAIEMAADIENYLAGRPLRAGPTSKWYRICKWGARNKPALAFSGVVLAILVLSTGLILRQQADHREQLKGLVVQLAGGEIDPAALGATIISKIRDGHAAALERAGVSESQRDASGAMLEQELAGLDSTQLAGDVLFDAVISPFVESLREANGLDPESRASLAKEVSEKLEQVNQWNLAVVVQKQAVELFERALGPDHEQTGASLYDLGRLQMRCGRSADAIIALERAARIASRSLDGEKMVAGAWLMVADAHRRLGEPAAGRAVLDSNRKLLLQHFRPQEIAMREGLLSLAQHRYDEAMKCFTYAGEQDDGKSPEFRAVLTANMGLVHLRAGRPRDAEIALREAVSVLAELHGQSPEVARLRLRLAEALVEQGAYEHANEELTESEAQLLSTSVAHGELNQLASQVRRMLSVRWLEDVPNAALPASSWSPLKRDIASSSVPKEP